MYPLVTENVYVLHIDSTNGAVKQIKYNPEFENSKWTDCMTKTRYKLLQNVKDHLRVAGTLVMVEQPRKIDLLAKCKRMHVCRPESAYE